MELKAEVHASSPTKFLHSVKCALYFGFAVLRDPFYRDVEESTANKNAIYIYRNWNY
jgi:hypothetical protein